MISFVNLTTGYRNHEVTRGIDTTLCPGQLTCLLGSNGAGKSTLLKTLCAFIPPLAGEIRIDGTDIRHFSSRELARRIGVVLTERPAGMNMTVEELVAIGRSPYTSFFGSLRNDDRETVDAAIKSVGIDQLRHRGVHTLSDGERQKAMIAKALAQDTEIILLDEPTAFLDYPSKVEIMDLLHNIAREQDKTVFMSTHDIDLAIKIADSLWLLDRPHGLRIGSPEELAADGSIAAYFERGSLRFDPENMGFRVK